MSLENLPTQGRDYLPEDALNLLIKKAKFNTNLISDGYHTFGELYEHRIILFIALCKLYDDTGLAEVWKSKLHHDGTGYEGWFIMGINTHPGHQISYHLPVSKWDETEFIKELDKAPAFDGHTPTDVLERLSKL